MFLSHSELHLSHPDQNSLDTGEYEKQSKYCFVVV